MSTPTTVTTENSVIYVQKNSYLTTSTDNVAHLMNATEGLALNGAVDGLIFTPITSYVFGFSHLAYKWQDLQDFNVDISSSLFHSSSEVISNYFKKLRVLPTTSMTKSCSKTLAVSDVNNYSPGFVYKCIWLNKCWTIDSVRLDKLALDQKVCKAFLDVKEAIECSVPILDAQKLLNIMRLQETLHFQVNKEASFLDTTVNSMAMEIDSNLAIIDTSPVNCRKRHPARCMPFAVLYSTAMDLVQRRQVERTVDEVTGLEIFSYLIGDSVDGIKSDVDISMSRGLILHSPSESILATPFVRFFRAKSTDFQFRSNRVVRASVKYDGSLIIAFKWNGELYTSTRRRMNSEQALVARNILRQSVRVQSELKDGWTYLLELIGGDNLHVSQYPMSLCLVLLTALNCEGIEVDVDERMDIAERADLLYLHTIYGYIDDIASISQGRGVVCDVPLHTEGWVVEDPVDGTRFKMINNSWEKASIAVKSLVNPCVVWHALSMCTFQSLQSNPDLPPHAKVEINLMADAIVSNAMIPIRSLIREYKFVKENKKVLFGGESGKEAAVTKLDLELTMPGDDLQECDPESIHDKLIKAAKKKDVLALVSLLSLAVRLGVKVDVKEVVRQSVPVSEWNCTFMVVKKELPGSGVLRLLLLHGAIPGHSLENYSPSPWLAQTFAKGWQKTDSNMKKLASWDENMDSPIQFIFAILSVEVFRFLFTAKGAEISSEDIDTSDIDCRSFCLVCRLWRERFMNEYSSEIPKWKMWMENCRRVKYCGEFDFMDVPSPPTPCDHHYNRRHYGGSF
eukprot:CAMPEP_0170099968 /NCGR_PEP_ID=MMETSP0020_2-20130122/1358_1 /TAXON_ID=98059 /ORGANISM="Dinobryon sp., Strain UTEXLB2267" /LENGTH=793 /DNA_ID=CAMNT_0010322733 /DNA_START=834 /DNA_END=3215 /DNA_ORIENTATION=+